MKKKSYRKQSYSPCPFIFYVFGLLSLHRLIGEIVLELGSCARVYFQFHYIEILNTFLKQKWEAITHSLQPCEIFNKYQEINVQIFKLLLRTDEKK